VADGARTHDNWNHNPGLYQLSYSHHIKIGLPDRNRTCNPQFRKLVLYPVELRAANLSNKAYIGLIFIYYWSGWRDSNSRHPAPKAGALPGYATPRTRKYSLFTHYGQLLLNIYILYLGKFINVFYKHSAKMFVYLFQVKT
jgi:hypothetical protein